MTEQSFAHESVAWAKLRLDDLDTIISEVEKSSTTLKESARKGADRALARLQEAQVNLQKYYDDLRRGGGAVKRSTEEVQNAIEAEWVDVESALQSFLSAAGDQADTVRGVVSARAQAQRQSWEAFLTTLRKQATEIVDRARGESDAAIKRLSDETEKFQSRIGEAKDAGDESWSAVTSGLAEAKAVHDRTIRKIKEAFSKLL